MGTNKENIKEKNWCKKGRKIKKRCIIVHVERNKVINTKQL